MKRVAALIIGTCLLGNIGESFAYEPGTHGDISVAAARQSILGIRNGLLAELGLMPLEDKSQFFPNPQAGQSINLGPENSSSLYTAPLNAGVEDLIRAGAQLEDEFPRSLFHFYDPVPGHFDPLNINGIPMVYSAADWALADSLLPVAGQSYSLNDANEKLQLEVAV